MPAIDIGKNHISNVYTARWASSVSSRQDLPVCHEIKRVCNFHYLPGLTWETIQSSYVSASSVVNEAFAWWLMPSFFDKIPFRESRIWKWMKIVPKDLRFNWWFGQTDKKIDVYFYTFTCIICVITTKWSIDLDNMAKQKGRTTHMCSIICLKQNKSRYCMKK